MSTKMFYTIGNIQAGASEALWVPQKVDTSQAGVIVLHGATQGATPAEVDGPGWFTVSKLISQLGDAGIPCIAGFMGGNTYGNNSISGTGVNDYCNKALAYMAAQTGCRAGKAHAFGLSMGAFVGLRWASLNPSKATSVVGGIPLVDMTQAYTSATVGGVDFRTAIQTAWGVTYPTPLPVEAEGIETVAPALAAAGTPVRLFYTTDDPYIQTSDVAAFDTAGGPNVISVSLGTGGHTAAAVAKMEDWDGGDDWSAMVEFFRTTGSA